jgi:hypothetical protein
MKKRETVDRSPCTCGDVSYEVTSSRRIQGMAVPSSGRVTLTSYRGTTGSIPGDFFDILGGQSGTETGFSSRSFGSPLLVIILQLLQTYLSLTPELCDDPDHAAHYHILSL